jgi:signal transduction histidine kinase
MPDRQFELKAPEAVHLLSDEPLLAQAIWSALSYAAVIDEANHPVVVTLRPEVGRTEIEIAMTAPAISKDDIERAFEPFASVQYEGGGGDIRSAVGLFLCREIARLHGGTLGARTLSETQRAVVITLPS